MGLGLSVNCHDVVLTEQYRTWRIQFCLGGGSLLTVKGVNVALSPCCSKALQCKRGDFCDRGGAPQRKPGGTVACRQGQLFVIGWSEIEKGNPG